MEALFEMDSLLVSQWESSWFLFSMTLNFLSDRSEKVAGGSLSKKLFVYMVLAEAIFHLTYEGLNLLGSKGPFFVSHLYLPM